LEDWNIVANSHNGSERHGTLIQRLQEVREHHDWEYPSIDEFLQPFVFLLCDDDGVAGSVGVFGDFVVDTIVVDMVALLVGARQSALNVSNVFLVDGSIVNDLWCLCTVVTDSAHVEVLRMSQEV
jgi:hypothetical protein